MTRVREVDFIFLFYSPCKVMAVKGSLLEKRSTFGRLLALFTNTLNDILLHFYLAQPQPCAVPCSLPASQLSQTGQWLMFLPCAAPLALGDVMAQAATPLANTHAHNYEYKSNSPICSRSEGTAQIVSSKNEAFSWLQYTFSRTCLTVRLETPASQSSRAERHLCQ